MIQYPITKIDKDEWNKKVNACLMYTIPSEDQALPILTQFEQILQRLHKLPLEQTLSQELVQYFFLQVFPLVCQKIIKSRYFKNQSVLKKSNSILQHTVCLLPVYINWLDKIPQFIQVLQSVFPEQYYYKTNNQLEHKDYPYLYFPKENNQFQIYLQKGSKIDVMKFSSSGDKFYWSHGQITQITQQYFYISYDLDYTYAVKKVQKNSYYIAPYQSKCTTFQWRKTLKQGDLLDVLDSFGSWYNATVVSVQNQQDGRKKIEVTLKIYNQNGNKIDEHGRYFGFNDYKEVYDAFSAQIAPYCSVAKQFSYQSSKSQFDQVDDQNDMQFKFYNGKKVYALPRKKHLSETLFKAINRFGQLGGFQKTLQKIQQKGDLTLLSLYLKGLNGVSSYIHKQIILQQIERLKILLQKNILTQSNTYTKQKSQMLFNGLRALLKRIYTTQISYQYQNNLKIKLVELNFQHDALKKKLHGLNELKQIVKSLTFGSVRNKKIIQWIKDKKIFQKVYLVNSHVQLIKKSQNFFRYIINQSILEVEDLQKLLKMAQKGDYQTRISLYSLFQEVSHIFKKDHVNFLIDKILESQPNLILNQDIDLLHQLSKFSNYFPMKKVMEFFQKLTLGDDISAQLNNYAIKKYSDMVAKNYEMKSYRKQILKQLFVKLRTHNIKKVAKILKHIFQGIGFGQWGKKDLNQILQQQKFDQIIVSCIQESKQAVNKVQIIQECMQLLICIYKICTSFKIKITIIESIHQQIADDKKLLQQYYKWCNQTFKCEQGIEVDDLNELINLFIKLFENRKALSSEQIMNPTEDKLTDNVILEELQLLKSIFIEVNKRKRFLTVSNVMKQKEIQKQFKRKVPMKELTFYQTLLEFIYDTQNVSVSEKSIQFFKILYCSGQNTQQQTQQFLLQNISLLKQNITEDSIDQQTKRKVLQTLRIIQFVIDDSQKQSSIKIDSLITKKKSYDIKLNFINSVNYITDTVKKMQITIPSNFTLYDLRMHLAKQLDIPWKSVKIQGKKQIPFLMNSRTMKQLGLTGLETLTVTKKPLPSEPQGEIIIDGQMNPKAERVFREIFNQYSTDGKMSKSQCHDFTVKCLGSSSSPKFYEDKINNLFNQYDQNKDDFLEPQDFLKFYKTAAISRASTVWSNLRSFGVQGNFKFSHQPNEQLDQTKLPRYIMSQMPQIYNILFRLLKQPQLAFSSFQLLQRLPVSRYMQQQVLCINSSQFNFQQIFNTTDLYVFFYKLNIIQYLSTSTELRTEEQRDWTFRFISNNGFEKIIQIWFKFIENYKEKQKNNQKSKVVLSIIEILVDMITPFLMKCFITKPILSCQLLLSHETQVSQKIQFLVTGHFSKPQIKLRQLPQQLDQQYQFKSFTKLQILQKVLTLLECLWRSFSISGQNNSSSGGNSSDESILFTQQILISKLLLFVPLVQINQDFSIFVTKMISFIQQSKNIKYVKKFYQLILCLTFYSQQGCGQKQIINEMFKHLTMKNIISDHFSILAVLVSKYGVETINQNQIIEVLIKNIFQSDNQLTIEGCSRLMLNFSIQNINQKQFDKLWQHCLFGEQKRAKKNSTRQALYDLILKSSDNKCQMTNYIINQIKKQISECIQHMRITSCTEDNQRSQTGFAGLKNLGNICYINSMMQQLYHNKNFRSLVLRIKDNQPQNLALYKQKLYDDNILHQFQRIFAYLQLTSRADYVPSGFCLAYKPFGESVNVMMQQDVQEFVSMFFDQIENKIKETPFRKILDTFYLGKSTNLFNCHDCNQTKKVEQNFYSITLEVKNSKTLSDSFNKYISGQLISDFRCDFCNKKVDVSKKTRISKPPRTLILHLQRIFFNLDTFINQKITTKHSFPMSLDLYPYSLSQYEKPKQMTPEQQKALKDSMQYNLTGIICHIGNAQSGHYISYIKIQQNKWVQFNDSLVMSFNPNNIEAECFGGVTNSFVDDFQWDRSTQTSKSAYVLLYERIGQTRIQAIVKSIQQKQLFLKQYSLNQVIQKISSVETVQNKEKQQSQSQQQISQQQKLQQEMLKLEVQEQIRKKSRDIDLDLQKIQQIEKEIKQSKEVVVQIDQNISFYIPQGLKKQILHDNQIHFFEKNLASPAFVKFFAQLLKHQHTCHDDILKTLKSLTFGFWAKSQHFKDLLKTFTHFIQLNPKYSQDLIFQNPQIITYLIQNPDSQVRTGIAMFLANTFTSLIQKNNLKLNRQTQLDNKIVGFLDQLFSLLATTVSKSWTKFGQYFQFWYQFATKGRVQLKYMVDKQILKHFLDYYLDKKSPLKIYENKPQIGSKYANPNFSMLLKTVTYLISQILNSAKQQKLKLSKDDYLILIHFDCMEKLISQNYQNLAMNLVKQVCKNNLYASQKIAIILLKGLHKSTFNNVQPYLDVLHTFVLIEDQYQQLRVKWVLGKPSLNISTATKQINAIISYSFQERVYNYFSSISLQQASSLLDPIYQLHKRAQNFAMMSLKQTLKLCLSSDFVLQYVWNLPPPTLCYGHIYDFYIQFIDRYIEDAKRSYSYTQSSFNKQQLGNQVKQMYEKCMIFWNQKQQCLLQQQIQNKYKLSQINQKTKAESDQKLTSQQSITTKQNLAEKQFDHRNNHNQTNNKIYYPIKFNFIQKNKYQIQNLDITQHQSQITFVLLEPTTKGNDSFLTSGMQRNIDRIKQNVWETAKTQLISGFYVQNKSKNLLRIKTDDGTQLVKPTDFAWVWSKTIQKVWQCQRTSDWPKWSLYSIDQQEKIEN